MTDSAPAITSEKNQRAIWGVTTATEPVRPDAKREALGEITKSKPAATSVTRSRVAWSTLGKPRSARDTVAVETPAAAATSRIVIPMPTPFRV